MNNKSIKVNTNIISHIKGLMIKKYFILLLLNFSFSYEVGDYINLIDQNKEFQICYGSDDENNTVMVGNKENLEIKKIKLRDLNILASKKELDEIINIKVRSTGRLLKAKIKMIKNIAEVEILDKETGISPGQACVFYSKDDIGDKVLGGGWIDKTFNNNLSTKLTA